ncbi:MAG: class I SAM-dependent DNA methyltransferase, partial [Propionibacteriaceae bacterium]|nr:class I SAM-dependent DNA methyltransferase [Propionibacteriaceae bacterium]
MSVYESIIIAEDWISEHFFTTSGAGSFATKVKERVKAWDDAETAGLTTSRNRFSHARRDLLVSLFTFDEDEARSVSVNPTEAYDLLLNVLGYVDGSGLTLTQDGPLNRVSVPGVASQAPLVIVQGTPVETAEDLLVKDAPTLSDPVRLHEDTEVITSVARLLSALFTDDAPPAFVLVLAGRIALLAEKGRWPEGRYLAINLQLVAERNDTRKGGEMDTALTCLEARSLLPDADGGIWWDRVLAESIKHTVGVSKDLRDGVRLSIELISQEVVDRRTQMNLAPLPSDQAQPLARQALRFLYRILFLLYAEAQPGLDVLPTGAPEYDQGYSLDRLRELLQVKLATPQAKAGTHLYESLAILFRLVDQGHQANGETDLQFNALRADLFTPKATALIDEARLGNETLQRVLANLLLSKEQRGRDRGFISYAELGINQLGAVYEGLMSYTGFFAETDLYEVARGGDNSKGSWVVPADRIDDISETDFVRGLDPITGEMKPILHRRGSFVFRLAGRERQQSASYYTPEVLTKFTVKQALEELLDQDGLTPAREILGFTVCEPALGSGAFAIEATRQLAERYLRRRQEELGRRIDPDDYPRELQKAKAYIALHNVYGVDLNATAVELAEISLWLDTMVAGLAAPWFGLRLRRGNSLIGARRAVYSPSQVQKGNWLKAVARDLPLTSLAADAESGTIGTGLDAGIHHFLLPADGWGAAADAKEAKDLAPEAVKELKQWRSSIRRRPNAKQIIALQSLAIRVETLWQFALQRLRVAEQQTRRSIAVWGADDLPGGGTVQREEIERALADANGAFSRLRRVMDAWCAMWFWPLTKELRRVEARRLDPVLFPGGQKTDDLGRGLTEPPTLDQWIAGLRAILGSAGGKSAWNTTTLVPKLDWAQLEEAEVSDLAWATAQDIERAKHSHPWLEVCERVAEQQGFFHWELDYATVFVRGGFDLQVGNPPWVRPDVDIAALLAEEDPWWQLAGKPTQEAIKARRVATLTPPGVVDLVIDGITDIVCASTCMSATDLFPTLGNLRPDTYRCFMEQVWRHSSGRGASGLIHPETHFTDEHAGLLRSATYRRVRRHWQFINELQLFEEVHNLVQFGVHIYGVERVEPAFVQATSLYHPETVD